MPDSLGLSTSEANKEDNTPNKLAEFLKVANSHIGEGGSWTWRTSGLSVGAAWCAAFVVACAKTVGVAGVIIPIEFGAGSIPRKGDVSSPQYDGKSKGTWIPGPWWGQNVIPQPGDLILYRWENRSYYSGVDRYFSDHIGIVTGANSSNVNTVEGNTSGSKVGTHSFPISYSCINGYFRPNWSNVGGSLSGLPSFGLSASISVDYNQLTPYIITIDRYTKSIKYKELKEMGVSGVMIEAGRLYSNSHKEQSYRNPKLDEQVRAASDADVPFALYTDVRARSVEEGRKELYELSFCIRRYPPALGVWLYLNLSKSKSENNKIIDLYYKELVALGLKNKIGFYTTKEQLDKIDWKKYSEEWYLWINKHVSRIDDMNQLLTPEFFVVGSDQ